MFAETAGSGVLVTCPRVSATFMLLLLRTNLKVSSWRSQLRVPSLFSYNLWLIVGAWCLIFNLQFSPSLYPKMYVSHRYPNEDRSNLYSGCINFYSIVFCYLFSSYANSLCYHSTLIKISLLTFRDLIRLNRERVGLKKLKSLWETSSWINRGSQKLIKW
jgi:hypothetical protein